MLMWCSTDQQHVLCLQLSNTLLWLQMMSFLSTSLAGINTAAHRSANDCLTFRTVAGKLVRSNSAVAACECCALMLFHWSCDNAMSCPSSVWNPINVHQSFFFFSIHNCNLLTEASLMYASHVDHLVRSNPGSAAADKLKVTEPHGSY